MSDMSTLIIDGQIFQSAARDRGMGRYSAKLIASMMAEGSYHATIVVLNAQHQRFDISNKQLKKILSSNIRVVRLKLQTTQQTSLEKAAVHNRRALEDFLKKEGLQQADFLIPSLFQEPIVSVFPEGTKKIVVFYDLIPYLYYERYRGVMPYDNYLKRFRQLFEANMILAISQAVRDDLIQYLGMCDEEVVAIDGAAIRSDAMPVQPSTFSYEGEFVLMPTSDDPRKNNLRAVLGFEQANKAIGGSYKLVITSKIHPNEQERLRRYSNDIIFTNNVKDEELEWLYERSAAVLFVPEAEGLGLPILEAVELHKKVVCSSIDVFKEISETAFFYCNHESQNSIAQTLIEALDQNTTIPLREYKRIKKYYEWAKTAQRSLQAVHTARHTHKTRKPKIAIFAPVASGLSAVGKVVAEGHKALFNQFEIDYYIEQGLYDGQTRPDFLRYVANCYPATSFGVQAYQQYDAVIYHIGNSDYHIQSICNSLYLPGVVILHDTNISEAFRILAEKRLISEERLHLEKVLTKKVGINGTSCLTSIIRRQRCVVVHSEFAKSIVNAVSDCQIPVERLQLATQTPLYVNHRNYEQITVGLAGIIAGIKGVSVIRSLAQDASMQDVRFKLFGYNFATQEEIEEIAMISSIELQTNLSDFEFVNNMKKLDIFVNYRMQYQGETSLSTLEAMRQGVVVIVRDVGWYSELPDAAVIKVSDEADIVGVINDLRTNKDKLREFSNNARQYVAAYHNTSSYAEGLAMVAHKMMHQNARNDAISNQLHSGMITTPQQLIDAWDSI